MRDDAALVFDKLAQLIDFIGLFLTKHDVFAKFEVLENHDVVEISITREMNHHLPPWLRDLVYAINRLLFVFKWNISY